jgi:arylsulfatase A-like enzyme
MRILLLLFMAVVSLHAADKPNIVLILADDLGINDLACYGRKDHSTPHLDRLAEQGMKFTCALTAQPICSPSRAALLTGKCPARLHLTNFLLGRADAPSQKLRQPRIEGQLPLEQVTLAELLREAGYATGMFGKWHLGGEGYGPKEQGFDTALITPANTKPSAEEGGKGEYAITSAAEQFIEANKEKPFFCYVAHNCPHIPLGAKDDLVKKNAAAFHPTYAAMIETLDDSVGRLMRKVEALKLEERTIFIFTSDNGGLHVLESPGTPATHNTPFRAGKGFLYEGGLREPLLVRWPGTVKPASICDTPVVLTDLMPTLLEAAGVNAGQTVGPLDGVSLLPLLRGGTMPPRTFYWHFPHYTNQGSRPAGAVREGNWKLIEHFEDASAELFDLAKDPGEQKNVAAENAKVVEDLTKKLHAWQKSVGAQMLEPNPEFDAAKHRALYVDRDPSSLKPAATAAETEPQWKPWRAAMNAAVAGRKPEVTPATGMILLPCRTAVVHGEKLRYEPQSFKNTLGFWVKAEDWAEWNFEVPAAGRYELDVLQGCGKGSGGAQVEFEVGGKTFPMTVQETGHFQHFIRRSLGVVDLPAGKATLAVKPKSKPGGAVMDLREARLVPVAK